MLQIMTPFFGCMLFHSLTSLAQNDLQMSIQSGNKIITVSKTVEENDMISFSVAYWDALMTGTKYMCEHLAAKKDYPAWIEIADEKEGLCKGGIGFSCSISDRPLTKHWRPSIVNHNNRLCAVTITKKTDGSVRIIFNDKVDWEDLQKN